MSVIYIVIAVVIGIQHFLQLEKLNANDSSLEELEMRVSRSSRASFYQRREEIA